VKVYLHDTVLHFRKVRQNQINRFDFILNDELNINFNTLKGNILINIISLEVLNNLFTFLQDKKPTNVPNITFNWNDKKAIKMYLKARFFYIKAAGGLVLGPGGYLFIYRLKKWDLPKGKLEKNEEVLACALREVEEECSVKVQAGPKIGSTWHCYPTKNGWCVKKSTWFLMQCTDDSEMKPQLAEDIEDIAWVAHESVDKYLAYSYETIKEVFAKAKKKGLI
jgi:8-oxo-dGTP pyrophosphatase MutT (NUDIX family)